MLDSDNEKPETSDFLDVLRQKIRVQIIILLFENVELSYTELLNMINIDEGLLNFHLRKIKKFVHITDKRTYMLSNYGKIAHEILWDIDKKIKPYGINKIDLEITKKDHITNLIGRRTIAFLIDIFAIIMSSGVIFERNITNTLTDLFNFNFSINQLPQFSHETIMIYSNVLIASFMILTILEAYKGQTLGKYLMGLKVVKNDGRKITLMDSAIRNMGKIFFLPIDIILGIILYRKMGYIRFFCYYTETKVIKISTY